MIDALCLPGFFGGKSEPFPANERIEQRGFSHIRPSHEGKLRQPIGGTVLSPDTALHKLSLHNLSIISILTQHYVGALQDSSSERGAGGGDVSFWGHKKVLKGNLDVGVRGGDGWWMSSRTGGGGGGGSEGGLGNAEEGEVVGVEGDRRRERNDRDSTPGVSTPRFRRS